VVKAPPKPTKKKEVAPVAAPEVEEQPLPLPNLPTAATDAVVFDDEEKTVSEVSSSCNQEVPPKQAAATVKMTKTIEKKEKKVIPAMKLTMQKQRKAAVKQE